MVVVWRWLRSTKLINVGPG